MSSFGHDTHVVKHALEHTSPGRQITGAVVTGAVLTTKVLAGTSAAAAMAAAAPVVAPFALAAGLVYAAHRALKKS